MYHIFSLDTALGVVILGTSDRWNNIGSGMLTRRKQLGTWFLLGYLVLFMNLGPNAHRLQCLGLHSISRNSPENTNETAVSCYCCHCSTASEQANQSSGTVHEFDDCVFCKFFKQFHVICQVINFDLQIGLLPGFENPAETSAELEFFVACARGPPVVC